jgi:hypothetical protein
MREVVKWIGLILEAVDKWVKRIGAPLTVIVALGVLVPWFDNTLHLASARRFGAHGIIKYEIGQNKMGDREPTDKGQLRLLRNGPREYKDIMIGNVVQAMSEVSFHEDGSCAMEKNCGSSPVVFDLQKGDCAIVLNLSYEDNGPDDDKHIKKQGGWLEVATSACGLFK